MTRRPILGRYGLVFAAMFFLAGSGMASGRSVQSSYGSGFAVVDGHLIVTASHVVRGKSRVFVASSQPPKWEVAEVVATSPELDLTVLRTDRARPPLVLANWASVPHGLEALIIGYPLPAILGFSPKVRQGMVSGEPADGTPGELFQLDAVVYQGNSGGPVIAPDGTVIGMVRASMQPARFKKEAGQLPFAMSFAVKSSALMAFLGQTLSLQPQSRPVDLENVTRPSVIFKGVRDSVVVVWATDSSGD